MDQNKQEIKNWKLDPFKIRLLKQENPKEMDENKGSYFTRQNVDRAAGAAIVASVAMNSYGLSVHLILMVFMNSGRIAMLGPFMSSLQILSFALHRLKINSDEGLSRISGEMYAVASMDVIPDPILELLQKVFGSYAPVEKLAIGFQYLNIESNNFIINTGSLTIFFSVNIGTLFVTEVIINLIILNILVKKNICLYNYKDYLQQTVINMRNKLVLSSFIALMEGGFMDIIINSYTSVYRDRSQTDMTFIGEKSGLYMS